MSSDRVMPWFENKFNYCLSDGKSRLRAISGADLDELTTLASLHFDGGWFNFMFGKIVHCHPYGQLRNFNKSSTVIVPDDVTQITPFLIIYAQDKTSVVFRFKTADPSYVLSDDEKLDDLKGVLAKLGSNGAVETTLPITPAATEKKTRLQFLLHDSLLNVRDYDVIDIKAIPTDQVGLYHRDHRAGAVMWTPEVYYRVAKQLCEMEGLDRCFGVMPEVLPDTNLTTQKEVTITRVNYSNSYTGCVTLVTSTGEELPFVTLPKKYRKAVELNLHTKLLPEPMTITF